MAQAEESDRAPHRVGDQQTGMASRRQCLDEQGEVAGVAIVAARARAARPAPGARGTALPAPVETPYRQAAGGEVSRRFEVFLDAFGKAADHHAFDARLGRRQMAPAQSCSVRGGKITPDKTGRLKKPRRKRRHARYIVFKELRAGEVPLLG